MTPFKLIEEQAEVLQGGAETVLVKLPVPRDAQALTAVTDSELLSLMSRRIFRAGLKHSMVDAKWPAFEEVFFGFDIQPVRMMSDEALQALLNDQRIIRHWGKIKSVRANAAAIHELSESHTSFGHYLAAWPTARIVELWDELKKHFTQLGGNSGPYFLRMAGKDTFLITPDVIRALNRWDVIEGEAKSKKARTKLQEAFNQWVEESGKPLCQISMILALSVD